MNRHNRRAAAKESRVLASKRPVLLEAVPKDRWPIERMGTPEVTRIAVFCNRDYLVQVFSQLEVVIGSETYHVGRMTVNRATLDKSGRFDDEITWDQLQDLKRQVGFRDHYAIEIYPRGVDVVNVANMRHLWLFDRPLPIGWFNEYA